MFKENKKQQVESNILGLRSTQRTKVYVVESAAQGCSAKKYREIFGKIHRKMPVQETFLE